MILSILNYNSSIVNLFASPVEQKVEHILMISLSMPINRFCRLSITNPYNYSENTLLCQITVYHADIDNNVVYL
jgi:hypothetical protein